MNTFKINALTAAIISTGLASQAFAGETIEFSDDLTLDWKGTATYSTAVRLQERDSSFSDTSKNSGNNNFDKSDFINNSLSLLMEGHLRYKNYGFVMSGSTFYDDIYHDDKFTDDAKRNHGGYTRILDAYAYTSFPFGEYGYADIRVGSHVVAWGEALFFPSMSLAQGPSDGIKALVPGTEVKDILLPEEQVSMQLELTPDLSVMAHYQYDWHETVVPEPGSFWSTSEAVGEGATCLGDRPDVTCTFGVRGEDITPDAKQWGVGARYRLTDLTEVGLYYLNYNSRIPTTIVSPTINAYQVGYMEDIDLYGATFSTSVGAASIAGEISYKKGAPVLASTELSGNAVPTPTRADVLQTNLNAIVNFGSSPISDSATLTTEIAYVDIRNVEEVTFPNLGVAAPGFPVTDKLYWTSYGLAASASLNLAYPGITENWDMGVPMSYARQLKGRTLTGGVGGEGDHRFSLGADFTHHRSGVQIGVKYTAYMGSHDTGVEPYEEKKLNDRDNVALTVKYAF